MRTRTSIERSALFTIMITGVVGGGCALNSAYTIGEGSGDPRIVAAGQLAAVPDLPLDDALARVRPTLLRHDFRNRDVAVYIDRQPSSFEALHAIPARMVLEVRLLTLTEAEQEYGSVNATPVLHVRLRHDVSKAGYDLG